MMVFSMRMALAGTLLILGSTAATAQETPATAFARAMAALNQRLGTVEAGPPVETTDIAANAADLAVIEQAMGAFATPVFPVDGFTTFETVCEPLNRLSVRHALDGASALRRPVGAPPPDAAETAALTAQIQALQQRNGARHQDAIAILATSGLRCTVAHFSVLAQFLASLPPAELTPVRLNGARQMRLGIAQSLLGSAVAMREAGTSAANRRRFRAFVADVATPFSRALTPELRAELSTALAGLPATTDADTLASTTILTSALATQECVELCLVR